MDKPTRQLILFDGEIHLRMCSNNCTEAQMMCARHWHEAYEVLYIRRGTGRQWINASQFDVAQGDLVLLRPGDVHATEALSADGCDIDVLQFMPEAFGSDADALRLCDAGVYPGNDALKKVFDGFWYEAQETRPGQTLMLSGLLRLLSGWVVRRQGNGGGSAVSGLIRQVCDHLETALSLDLKETAAVFGYSPEHLSRRFHAETGITYRRWCEVIRMRRAVTYLHRDGCSVTETAERLGYGDASGLIRAFRRTYGMTPYAYGHSVVDVGDGERV